MTFYCMRASPAGCMRSIRGLTVWERWNSVLPNGSVNGTGMNSLNHYA